jgi:hypothetical protein
VAGPGQDRHDASSLPWHSPRRTPRPVVRTIAHLRWKHRLGPVQIAARTAVASSTVYQVLVWGKISRLSRIGWVTGEQIRRYEHNHPGSLVHVDVKKLGNGPGGGGWRYVGRGPGPTEPRGPCPPHRQRSQTTFRHPLVGTAFIHPVLDDQSRVTHSEIHADKAKETAVTTRPPGSPPAARGSSASCPAAVPCYRSKLWAPGLRRLGITPQRTRRYGPQANGEIERFHRTLASG